jgi:hypothetical protein
VANSSGTIGLSSQTKSSQQAITAGYYVIKAENVSKNGWLDVIHGQNGVVCYFMSKIFLPV